VKLQSLTEVPSCAAATREHAMVVPGHFQQKHALAMPRFDLSYPFQWFPRVTIKLILLLIRNFHAMKREGRKERKKVFEESFLLCLHIHAQMSSLLTPAL